MEASAKEKTNISEVMERITRKLITRSYLKLFIFFSEIKEKEGTETKKGRKLNQRTEGSDGEINNSNSCC